MEHYRYFESKLRPKFSSNDRGFWNLGPGLTESDQYSHSRNLLTKKIVMGKSWCSLPLLKHALGDVMEKFPWWPMPWELILLSVFIIKLTSYFLFGLFLCAAVTYFLKKQWHCSISVHWGCIKRLIIISNTAYEISSEREKKIVNDYK